MDIIDELREASTKGKGESTQRLKIHPSAVIASAASNGLKDIFYKTKMCLQVKNGKTCADSLYCKYAHSLEELRPLPDLSRTVLCKALEKTGSCNNPNCSFAHSRDELRTSTVSQFKAKMCNYYPKGKCLDGDSCRFAHSVTELTGAAPNPSKVDAAKKKKKRVSQSNSYVAKDAEDLHCPSSPKAGDFHPPSPLPELNVSCTSKLQKKATALPLSPTRVPNIEPAYDTAYETPLRAPVGVQEKSSPLKWIPFFEKDGEKQNETLHRLTSKYDNALNKSKSTCAAYSMDDNLCDSYMSCAMDQTTTVKSNFINTNTPRCDMSDCLWSESVHSPMLSSSMSPCNLNFYNSYGLPPYENSFSPSGNSYTMNSSNYYYPPEYHEPYVPKSPPAYCASSQHMLPPQVSSPSLLMDVNYPMQSHEVDQSFQTYWLDGDIINANSSVFNDPHLSSSK